MHEHTRLVNINPVKGQQNTNNTETYGGICPTAVVLVLLLLGVFPLSGWVDRFGEAQQQEGDDDRQEEKNDRFGEVLQVEGEDVEIIPRDTNEWQELDVEDIFLGDRVRTGEGRILIESRSGAIKAMQQNTGLQFIGHLDEEAGRVECHLDKGTLWVDTGGTEVLVSTDNAILRTHGTSFVVSFIPPDTSNVIVFEGSVEVRNRNKVYAVGASGAILHFDGSTWTAQTSGTSVTLIGVWGSNPSDVYAVGALGTILHFDGSTWTAQTSGTSVTLTSVWGSSPSDVYAVGATGTILHFDGSTWTAQTSGTSVTLTSVWGSSPSDVYAVGASGTILHFDGSTWTAQTSGTTARLTGVWSSSVSDIHAVGTNGVILHSDGTTWTAQTTVGLNGVWGSSARDVYAVGAKGTILHFDGTTWTAQTSGTTEMLVGVWSSNAGVTVQPGFRTQVLGKQPPTTPSTVRPTELEQIIQRVFIPLPPQAGPPAAGPPAPSPPTFPDIPPDVSQDLASPSQ